MFSPGNHVSWLSRLLIPLWFYDGSLIFSSCKEPKTPFGAYRAERRQHVWSAFVRLLYPYQSKPWTPVSVDSFDKVRYEFERDCG